jgi:hypothetical protein
LKVISEPVLPIWANNKVNLSWCHFETIINNTGSTVLEDWKFYLYFDENVRKVDDDFTSDFLFYEKFAKYRRTWAFEEDKMIAYHPLDDKPLIQKDSRQFKSFFIPSFDQDEVCIRWELLARDFSREGEVIFKIVPEYELDYKTEWVSLKEEEKEEIEIKELIKEKEDPDSLDNFM